MIISYGLNIIKYVYIVKYYQNITFWEKPRETPELNYQVEFIMNFFGVIFSLAPAKV